MGKADIEPVEIKLAFQIIISTIRNHEPLISYSIIPANNNISSNEKSIMKPDMTDEKTWYVSCGNQSQPAYITDTFNNETIKTSLHCLTSQRRHLERKQHNIRY
uniref:Uncharacterized protein n=1 Tax=Ascaris lumbricoides TaxID=6252 RepID=A0A0M3HPE1_ASCLU